MNKVKLPLVVPIATCLALGIWLSARSDVVHVPASEPESSSEPKKYTSTFNCRECHEKFYELWAPSHHGLAMQPYTDELARKALTPQKEDIAIGKYGYRAEIEPSTGWVVVSMKRDWKRMFSFDKE